MSFSPFHYGQYWGTWRTKRYIHKKKFYEIPLPQVQEKKELLKTCDTTFSYIIKGSPRPSVKTNQCLRPTERIRGYCFVVTQTPILEDEWKWVCLQA